MGDATARPVTPRDDRALIVEGGGRGEAPRPLTDRVLDRLGPPRLLWIIAWGAFAALTFELAYRLHPYPRYPGHVFLATYTYANIMALLALDTIARRLEALVPALGPLVDPHELANPMRPFRAVGSMAGPLLLDLVITGIFEGTDFAKDPTVWNALLIPRAFIGTLPLCTLGWVYIGVFLGLDRLGREPLHLRSFRVDRSLGLRPLGALAFQAFWLFTAVFFPFLFFTLPDVRSITVTALVALLGVVIFFLSLHRLHRQLSEAKAQAVAWARTLYAQVSEPIERDGAAGALEVQALKLSAVESLERRAASVQEWPFDQDIFARFAAIVTSVVAAIVARLILVRFGL